MKKDNTWEVISQNYKREREKASFNAILLDKLIFDIVAEQQKVTNILDFGAGIGTFCNLFGNSGYTITAYEPNDNMFRLLKEETDRVPNIKITNTKDGYFGKQYELILCLNVLDHIKNFETAVEEFYELLSDHGSLLLALPHPLKDLGDWEKVLEEGKWKYLYYRLDDYMKEGICAKTREDQDGNMIVNTVHSSHRMISTYYNTLLDHGFTVKKIYEPKPDEKYQKDFPILYEKSSRIPYFIVYECEKGVRSDGKE